MSALRFLTLIIGRKSESGRCCTVETAVEAACRTAATRCDGNQGADANRNLSRARAELEIVPRPSCWSPAFTCRAGRSASAW